MSQQIKEELPNTSSHNQCKVCHDVCDPYVKPALKCFGGCMAKIHINCLGRHSMPRSLEGDVFFELCCSECNPNKEEVLTRAKIPWLSIVILTLYNLKHNSSGISKRGYFHWKSDITTFVDRHWDYLFQKNVKRKKNWAGTISGTLSHYSGIVFKSGTVELGESGWWKLLDNDPPEILVTKNGKSLLERKKQLNQQKLSYKHCDSPTPSESSISVGDDSNFEGDYTKNQGLSMYSRAYVQPSETLSDFLLAEDDLNDIDMTDMEDGIELENHNGTPSFADLLKDFPCQNSFSSYQQSNTQISQLLENMDSEWPCDIMNLPEKFIGSNENVIHENEIKDENENSQDENCSDSSSFIEESPPISLFNESTKRELPWKKNFVPQKKVTHMSEYQEAYLLQRINKKYLETAPASIRRLYRKLSLRKLKREYSLPLMDIDKFGIKSDILQKSNTKSNRILDRFFNDVKAGNSEQRLQGHNEPTTVHSPYTNRMLKPFIRRDLTSRPLWLKVMEELLIKVNSKKNATWKLPEREPIDYSYVRPQHIPAINSLCSQFFWAGIDLTECLQYPDFSCVVLYKKLVIGFAFLVPDVGYNEAYISFFLTRPEWRRSGIGTFMLYHLIQTCMGKDVTLHVSATNPALILYQKFGFKIEEFVQDFYDKYLSPSSRDCKHALFLRLSR